MRLPFSRLFQHTIDFVSLYSLEECIRRLNFLNYEALNANPFRKTIVSIEDQVGNQPVDFTIDQVPRDEEGKGFENQVQLQGSLSPINEFSTRVRAKIQNKQGTGSCMWLSILVILVVSGLCTQITMMSVNAVVGFVILGAPAILLSGTFIINQIYQNAVLRSYLDDTLGHQKNVVQFMIPSSLEICLARLKHSGISKASFFFDSALEIVEADNTQISFRIQQTTALDVSGKLRATVAAIDGLVFEQSKSSCSVWAKPRHRTFVLVSSTMASLFFASITALYGFLVLVTDARLQGDAILTLAIGTVFTSGFTILVWRQKIKLLRLTEKVLLGPEYSQRRKAQDE